MVNKKTLALTLGLLVATIFLTGCQQAFSVVGGDSEGTSFVIQPNQGPTSYDTIPDSCGVGQTPSPDWSEHNNCITLEESTFENKCNEVITVSVLCEG